MAAVDVVERDPEAAGGIDLADAQRLQELLERHLAGSTSPGRIAGQSQFGSLI